MSLLVLILAQLLTGITMYSYIAITQRNLCTATTSRVFIGRWSLERLRPNKVIFIKRWSL